MKNKMLNYIKKNNLKHIRLYNYLEENSSINIYNAKNDCNIFKLSNGEQITLHFNSNTFKWSL
jgi:predicted secreted protein